MPLPVLPDAVLTKSITKDVDVCIVGLAQTSTGPTLVGLGADLEKAYAKRFGTTVLELATDLGAKPEAGTVTVLPTGSPRLLVVGLGDADVEPEGLRRAVGNAARAIANLPGDEALTVAVSLDVTDPELIKAATEGLLLGAYRYSKVTSNEVKCRVKAAKIVSASAKARAKDAVEMGSHVSRAVWMARDWVNTPPNLLYPESFAKDARAALKDTKVSVNVLDEKALEREGFGGIMTVGGGSSRKPRLVRMSYNPRGAKFHIAIVAKGITFDTGGLNLKPADGMATMKLDMAGAAALIATMRAISDLNLKVQVTGYAAMAENLPSSTAYRPSDVLTMYGGKTVENVNSDAEGRLVMADALVRAGEDKPDMIIDIATLTGACMVALGRRYSGLMASDDQTADYVLDAAEAAGELFWQLPIPQYLADSLTKSDVADVRSGSTDRLGGALAAAAFLRNFVPEGTPWAHLDIAGPSFNEPGPYDYVLPGGTGVGVRTLVALAASFQG